MERRPVASNILEGEASESDEEISDQQPGYTINRQPVIQKPPMKMSEGPSSGIVVSGEASESDEEDDFSASLMLTRNFPTLVSQQGLQEFELQDDSSVSIQEEKQQFESPFHLGIWERNFSLRLGIVRHHLEQYDNVYSKLKSIIPHSNRSQNHAQESLKCYRNITESSKQLNDNLETLLRQTYLPQLKIPFPSS